MDGVRVTRTVLRNGAVINVPAQVFAFTGGMLHYHAHQSGINIQLVNVYKTVKNANTGKPLNIVDGTSLQVEPNSFVVLVGGSGTGKSSLLTCITGTAPCTAGSVKFDGLDTRSNRNAFEAALGYVPQKDIMHDNLTVEQSLTYTAKLRIAHDATRAEIAAAVAHAIEAVDLQGREKTFISKLSGGQKKRVSIAMELLANPRLLILDEPTSGLSPDLDRSMMELCRRLSHQNYTVLMVTHNMSNIMLIVDVVLLVLFVVDVAASTAAAIGLNKYLREIDELRAKLRLTSDKLTTVLGTGAMTADTILDEQKLQLALAKLEGRENADVLRTELTIRAAALREKLTAAEHDHLGTRRLLRAFPDMKSLNYTDTLAATRAAMLRLRELAAAAKEKIKRA